MTRREQHHHSEVKIIVHGHYDPVRADYYLAYHEQRWMARQERLTNRLRLVHRRLKAWQNR